MTSQIIEGKKNVIGKLEIKPRLREPLLAKQIRVTREQILKIEKHFPITSPPLTALNNNNIKQPSQGESPVESTSPVTPVNEAAVIEVPITVSNTVVEGHNEQIDTSGPSSTESAPVSGQLTLVEPVTPVTETPVKEVPVTPAVESKSSEVSNNDVPSDWDR